LSPVGRKRIGFDRRSTLAERPRGQPAEYAEIASPLGFLPLNSFGQGLHRNVRREQLREAADAVVGVRISLSSHEPKEKNDEGSVRSVLIIRDFGLRRFRASEAVTG
jgi:hypothetical protein